MSDTDSFIEEVTEEVRRDQLYGYLRRYGWIAALVVILIVAGASWSEYRKSQASTAAQDLGDQILAALTDDNVSTRASAIAEVRGTTPEATAAVNMIAASALAEDGQNSEAAKRLRSVAEDGEAPEIYRQLAGFKALLVEAPAMAFDERRAGFRDFAAPGHPLRLLAEEQLALIDAEFGDKEAAIERLQSLLSDAEASSDLQQRALQVIVALGGEPKLPDLPQANN